MCQVSDVPTKHADCRCHASGSVAKALSDMSLRWAQNFIALQLESPFGCEPNDLPMHQMQSDWTLGPWGHGQTCV